MHGQRIFDFAKSLVEGALILRDAGHSVPALMLIYSGIDQMAWLSIDRERSSGSDFKAWVEDYMISQNPIAATADELWEARNALLHTGTAESTANMRDDRLRKIYYTQGGVKCTRNDDPKCLFLSVESLTEGYITAVLWFVTALEKDPERLSAALSKLGRMLSFRTFPDQ